MLDYKIIIKNQSSNLDKNTYTQLKPVIYEHVKKCLTDAELNILLYINIVDASHFAINKTQKATETAATVIQNKKGYTLLINSNDLILYTKGNCILKADIHHEIAHIYDMEQIKKYCGTTRQIQASSYNDYFYNLGTFFWTEVFAYYQTFTFYKGFGSENLYSLVKKIKYINKYYCNIINPKDAEKEDMLYDLLVDFEYFCTRFIAAYFADSVQLKNYSNKTIQDSDFKFVTRFLNKSFKYLIKIFKGYKKSIKKTLIKLGKYIFINLYCIYGYRLSITKNKRVLLIRLLDQQKEQSN